MSPMKTMDAVAGTLSLNPVEISKYDFYLNMPLDGNLKTFISVSPKERAVVILQLNSDLVTSSVVAKPKFSDKEMCSGVTWIKGNIVAEASAILRDRTEELMGGDAKETKGVNTWRIRLGADLAHWFKTRLSAAPEEQSINLFGSVVKHGMMYNLDYKKSTTKGEWSEFIGEDTNIEFANEFLTSPKFSAGLCVGYTQHDNTIKVAGMPDVKRLDTFFYPKIYIAYNPSPDFGLSTEWKGLTSKFGEGAEKGIGGVVEMNIKNLKLKLATEMMGNYKNNTISVNYTLK